MKQKHVKLLHFTDEEEQQYKDAKKTLQNAIITICNFCKKNNHQRTQKQILTNSLKKLHMNYNKGILGVFNLIWKRRKYSSFYAVFQSNHMTENECDDIYNNLRKAWMRTVLGCVVVIALVWLLYYIQRGILTLSFSVIITVICSGLPILLWLVFDWIENAINKHISTLRKNNQQPQKKKDYDDFDWLGI